MGGGLMQLVAYGAQDVYLTGNPQITFFKVVYRRHTNFSMEAIQQTIDGTPDFDRDVSVTISRNGDLVYKMYVEFNVSEWSTANHGISTGPNLTHGMLKEMTLEIGGQIIDKHTNEWLTIWNNLTEFNPSGEQNAISDDNGAEPISSTLYQRMSYNHLGLIDSGAPHTSTNAPTSAFVPLQFWFNRNPGLALPLIALQYHEVKLKIKFGGEINFTLGTNSLSGNLNSTKIWADYIYLDTDERRRFAQVSHEYLIEQLQMDLNKDKTKLSHELNFNHPVKELIWSGKGIAVGSLSNYAPHTPNNISTSANPGTFKLVLNGHDRFVEKDLRYFTRTQVWQHHTGYGSISRRDSIAVYSFALKPEEHQPSGTCNFSRIDNAQLVSSKATTNNLNVYAVNYNVLRIMSGMGGLAYSN
jgi:hypothetical protein